MDCLEGMKLIDNKSIDLIVIDPPYNINKAKWDKIKNYIEWMGSVFLECQRVLKDNGSFYFFHNDFLQMAELQHWIKRNTKFVFKSLITVDKLDNNYIKDLYGSQNHFRNYLNLVEYCLFYTFQDETGLTTVMLDINNFSTLRKYFKDLQEYIGLNLKQINAILRHRKAEHGFYWKTTQWDLPTEKTYRELIEKFNIDKWVGFRTYKSIRQEYENLRQEYESIRYTFNAKKGLKNIWEYSFREDKQYKHPTQKPIALIKDIILYSSNENDLILDCFMGSGTTAVAAINCGRSFIGFELDKKYFDIAQKRIDERKGGLFDALQNK